MSTFVSRLVLTSLAAALLWCAPRTARAADYTDVWWIPAESGWGVNVIQSENLLFLTFFIYGSDNKPTWYTAQLTLDATGAYSGGLYLTSGTYYALPWNTGDAIPAQQVGSASFKPSSTNAYQATLTYVVNGVGTVTKAVERQGLTTINLGGTYTGGLAGAQTGCSNAGTYRNTYDLQVSQTGAGATTFTFAFPTYSCTLSGTVALHGTQYTIDGATYQCTGGFSSTANMSEIKATAQGIEGRWVASTGGGCTENAYFSAVLY
jgi:hypothetical protein